MPFVYIIHISIKTIDCVHEQINISEKQSLLYHVALFSLSYLFQQKSYLTVPDRASQGTMRLFDSSSCPKST